LTFDVGIFFAALGITTLEVVETAAVALALHASTGRSAVFGYAALGTLAVFAPMFVLGALITLLPYSLIKVIGGFLLLYFGLRLARSARRAVIRARRGAAAQQDHLEKGVMSTAFSVGAVEAFEAAIVLVGLLPNDFQSTVFGMGCGLAIVTASAMALRSQVRKVKQADMKVVVSALLLSFSTFWFVEALTELSDLALIPLFALFVTIVYEFATRAPGERDEPSRPPSSVMRSSGAHPGTNEQANATCPPPPVGPRLMRS
jgi:uncharacterized membrane protein